MNEQQPDTTPKRLPPAAATTQRRGPGGPMANFGQPTEKPLDFGPSAKRLFGRLRPERASVLLALTLGVTSVAMMVTGPKILGHATDLIFSGYVGSRLPDGVTKQQAIDQLRASGHGQMADMLAGMDVVPGQGIDMSALGWVLTGVLFLYVAGSIASWLQARVINRVVNTTVYGLRRDVEAKINRLPLGYFDKQQRGEVLSRATNDIDNISQSLQQTMSQLVTSLLTVIGVVVMMFVVSPVLTVVALVTIPASILVTRVIARHSQKRFIAQWAHTGKLNGQIEEAFSGHALVKVFGRQAEVERDFEVENESLYRSSFGAQFISGLIMPTMMFIGNLNYVVIAVLGGLRVANGSMTLGDVQAFIQYSRQFTQPLTQVASMMNLMQSGVASAERVFALLDAPEQSADPEPAERPGEVRGRVEFEHVSFRYAPDTPLIEDLSLVAEPGQTVAIVGHTGAGKTTLVNLIMRFYDLDSGRITLDGVDIASMRRADVREEIGMVLQDTWLFGGTIRDNIAYGDPDAMEEDVLDAARTSYVDRFVRSLPDGYDTVIDDEGSNVSAGEKQLITIARAFVADPSILILDEATSSVDTRTEVLIQQAMAALRKERTSFVIAHRLSTIRNADVILVMDAGRIVEQGTHAELLHRRGAYFDLYNAQFVEPMAEDAALVG
jgi:ATP-binding cassette, subfamily B, multidrug efflux pump